MYEQPKFCFKIHIFLLVVVTLELWNDSQEYCQNKQCKQCKAESGIVNKSGSEGRITVSLHCFLARVGAVGFSGGKLYKV